jgi:ornithine carbamoyltransferase
MSFNLKGRSYLKLEDFTQREMLYLLDLSRDLKRAKYSGTEQPVLRGKNICLIREDVDAHALLLRGRGAQPGRPCDLS